ncbi:tripartite motif-containing protein 35 [Etheostoma spectabile]|uniref:tripartite motif-containing protein 35 n=1 Tax=Etheostoma spectabile TaxID=54343 RepID=UPI0013AFC867|nr:tripartite motif-containing protein 35-like [Etheostoma spectabile]
MSAPAPEPVRIEKVLKEHLDDLSEDELRDFQWYVTLHRGTDSKPVPKSQLQNASRTETVDKLVSFHGESGAVEITVDILMNHMNHNDLATRLTQALAGRNVEQQLHEPLSSAVRDTQRVSDLTITQDLTCSVCLDIFTEPVMLQCGHSFCRTCVHNKEKGKISPKCPLCNKVIQIDFKPQINYNLKSLSENYRRGRGGGHRNEVYQTPSRSITEKREAFEKVKEFCDSSIEQIKTQRHYAKKKITDDFEKLHLVLKREQETSIAELEEEATQKIGMMQKITELSRDTFSLSVTIKDLHDLGADNSLLQNFRTEMERAQNVLPDPQLLPQPLINVSKHVENLQCRVLEKMLSNAKSSSECILTFISTCPEQNRTNYVQDYMLNEGITEYSPIQPLPSDSDTDEDEDNEGPRFLDNNYKDNEGPRVLDHEDNEGPPDFLLTDVEELELYFEDDLYC